MNPEQDLDALDAPDNLAAFRANADQVRMLWSELMPVLADIQRAALAEGFAPDQAFQLARDYFATMMRGGAE